MPALADYRTALKLRGYDGQSDAALDAWINEGRRRVCRDKRWTFLLDTDVTLVTVAGNDAVALAGITDLGELEAVRLLDGTDPINLDWVPQQTLKDWMVEAPDTGTPRVWSRLGADILLYPTPDRVYTLVVDYVKDLGDLVAGQQDVIPAKLQELVIWAASVPAAFRQRELQTASAADQYYSKVLLPKAFAQDATEQRQTSRQVRSGYWGD